MATIYTRAGKGSALTWTEGDANITNLNNAKIENVVEDTTPQLGGNLDVNGNSIVSTSNGNIAIVPHGTGNIQLTPATGHVTISATNFPTGTGTNGQVLTTNGTGTASWTTPATGGASTLNELTDVTVTTPGTGQLLKYNGISSQWENFTPTYLQNLGEDVAPTLGGNLNVGSNSITSILNQNIAISPLGTGKVVLSGLSYPNNDGTNGQVLTTNGTGTLSWTSASGGITDVVQDTTPQLGGNLDVQANIITTSITNGNITITPDGTGDVILSADTVQIGELTNQGVLTTSGGNLRLNTNNGTNSGSITVTAGANGSISISPNGTGRTSVSALTYNEGAIVDLGTNGGTISPNPAIGNVQKITLNSALTINGFTTPVAGQSLTLIIYGGTAYTSITSTMKFAGGIKTLTGTAGCIDILSVYYDGTTYFASLGKGFA